MMLPRPRINSKRTVPSKLSMQLFGMSKRESGQRRATEDAENDDSLTAENAQGIDDCSEPDCADMVSGADA
jgi:hypothetical protein